jgi:SAM-dependent methyltransferase
MNTQDHHLQHQPLPMPPLELRRLVGPTDESYFDNQNGNPIFPDLPLNIYDFVFDFGCGCGRIARQLLQQRILPPRYVGIDLHKGMIEWCKQNLQPLNSGFEFYHHDVYNAGLNPKGLEKIQVFPVKDETITLFIAWSVFTHVIQSAAEFYLKELARVLHPSGIACTTWFLFEKKYFPMMQEFQNALFINDIDPTNAVIFDKNWLRSITKNAGLTISRVRPPGIRGYQWEIYMEKTKPGIEHVDFPDDLAPLGINRPPLMPANADELG